MEELDSILNYLETTSLEPHDDYISEFTYREQKLLWSYIKKLKEQNEAYKNIINTTIGKLTHLDGNLIYGSLSDEICDIINMLEKVRNEFKWFTNA